MSGSKTEVNPAGTAMPEALCAIPPDKVVAIDVRDDLRNGREPFSAIMAARQQVPEGGALSVRAIFEPFPLYAVMARQGLDHFAEHLGPEDWRVWFFPAGTEKTVASAGAPTQGEAAEPAGTGTVTILDVRDLEPPDPLIRTLAALEQLKPGDTLLQINARVPQFLLPKLEERGFAYEIREQGPDLVRVFIRRK